MRIVIGLEFLSWFLALNAENVEPHLRGSPCIPTSRARSIFQADGSRLFYSTILSARLSTIHRVA